MGSWWPFILLVLAGFFIGGVISFARTKRWFGVVVLGIGAVLCIVGAALWWAPA